MSSESWLIFWIRSWAIRFSERGSPVCVLNAFPSAVMILLVFALGGGAEGVPEEPEERVGVVMVILGTISCRCGINVVE